MIHAVIETAELGIVLLDEALVVRVWNPWLVEASGIPEGEAVGQSLGRLFPSLVGGPLWQAAADAIGRGKAARLASAPERPLLPLLRPGSGAARVETMDQSIVVKPLTGDDGTPCCLLQIADTTEAATRERMLRRQARTMEALAENYRLSELHSRAIVDHTADAIITFHEDGAIGTYNSGAELIFGYSPSEIVAKGIRLLVPDLDPAQGLDPLRAASGAGWRGEMMGRRKDGECFPLDLALTEMQLGDLHLFIAIAHDITERKRAEAELKSQKEWMATLINAIPDLVCLRDGEGRWLMANEAYLNQFQLAGADYQGKTAEDLKHLTSLHAEILVSTQETDHQAWRERRTLCYETLVNQSDLTIRTYEMMKVPLFHLDGGRKGLVVVGHDITERKQAAARIQHLAHHDSLTDLPNRVLFQDSLRHALAQARRAKGIVGALLLDLDKFKDVNDTLGHPVGDRLLKAVGQRLLKCVRESDTVARLGGDEFGIVLNNLHSPHGAATVADVIIRRLGEPFHLDGHEIVTATSIGITLYPGDADDAEQLLKNADLALYRSKAEGREQYQFYVSAMDAEVQARKAIERDLRRLLDDPGQTQLIMYYQPLVDVKTGAITGSEALIRWFHPEKGAISPALFIPIVERSDLIFPLGRWVIERACRQLVAWRAQGLPKLVVAVNLSAAQFKHHDLVDTIHGMLVETGVDPAQIQLEVTESIAMHNVELSIQILRQLRDLGLHISIDDFGTGYSSLNYLKRFPADKLKIDRSFVTDIGQHPDNAAIVKTIISLGHAIGTRVNVEGVETVEQFAFLRANGVDEAQGFLFAKPLPPDEFAALVCRPALWNVAALPA